MNTIANTVEDFIRTIKPCTNIKVKDYISQPINTRRATEEEIAQTEKKLSCTLPKELRDYYLNGANGTEEDEKEYPFYKYQLDIFSHQKIVGIYDYFILYWKLSEQEEEQMDAMSEEYYEESDLAFIQEKNKEYFVCIADWEENFIKTFVFDKEHNFYQFRLDQDCFPPYYIDELIDGSIKKDNSLVDILNSYLESKKLDITESYRREVRYINHQNMELCKILVDSLNK